MCIRTTSIRLSPLLSADGATLISNKDKIVERWAEHFKDVLNRTLSINDEALTTTPCPDLDITLTEDGVAKAMKQMSTGKAPRFDAIPAEVFNSVGPSLPNKLAALFQSFWESETLAQESKDATIFTVVRERATNDCVTTVEGYHVSPSLIRSLPTCSSVVS